MPFMFSLLTPLKQLTELGTTSLYELMTSQKARAQASTIDNFERKM
jgi:hypothetical protein